MVTKSQKISMGVLGVAAIAFCVDRFVLSPSGGNAPVALASEYAVSPASRAVSATPSAAPSPSAAAATSQATTLAGRLSAMAVTRRYQYVATGDAFRASDDWLNQFKKVATSLNEAASGAAAPTPESTARKSDPAAIFASRHTLSAVMHSQTGGMAIVDGKLYEVGRKVDGFELVEVGAHDATFDGNGTTVTLKLPGQIPVARIE